MQNYLGSNEKLIWVGQPKTGITLKLKDIYELLFSILFCTVLVFMMRSVLVVSVWFLPFFIPFILVGLLFLFGRYFIDAHLRKKTYYALSNKRIIIKSNAMYKKIRSVDLAALSKIEYEEERDRSGTIDLGIAYPTMPGRGGISWFPNAKAYTSLYRILEVRVVYQKILDLKKQINNEPQQEA
jgi:hypothetical protein